MDLYEQFSAWRVQLYQALSTSQLPAELARVIAGDMRQALDRLTAYQRPQRVSIIHGAWYALPDGLPVQAQGFDHGRWRFNLADGTPFLLEDPTRPRQLLRLVEHIDEPGAYAAVPSDLTLDELIPVRDHA